MICMKNLRELFPRKQYPDPLTFFNGDDNPKTGYLISGGPDMNGGIVLEIDDNGYRRTVTSFTRIVYGRRNVKDQVIRAIICAYVLSFACTLLPQAAPLHDFTNLFFFRKGIGF